MQVRLLASTTALFADRPNDAAEPTAAWRPTAAALPPQQNDVPVEWRKFVGVTKDR